MKLSTIIIEYRKRMGISQREFSRRCDLSNSYISFLENEYNPKTGKPIVPTIKRYKQLAAGMEITVNELFEILDEDAPVSLADDDPSAAFSESVQTPDLFSDEEYRLINAWRSADESIKSAVRKLLDM